MTFFDALYCFIYLAALYGWFLSLRWLFKGVTTADALKNIGWVAVVLLVIFLFMVCWQIVLIGIVIFAILCEPTPQSMPWEVTEWQDTIIED